MKLFFTVLLALMVYRFLDNLSTKILKWYYRKGAIIRPRSTRRYPDQTPNAAGTFIRGRTPEEVAVDELVRFNSDKGGTKLGDIL